MSVDLSALVGLVGALLLFKFGFPGQNPMIESVDLLSFRVCGRSNRVQLAVSHLLFGFCYGPYSWVSIVKSLKGGRFVKWSAPLSG